MCKDKIFPKVEYFAKGVGPADDPKRAFVLAFVIAVGFIAIGKFNNNINITEKDVYFGVMNIYYHFNFILLHAADATRLYLIFITL